MNTDLITSAILKSQFLKRQSENDECLKKALVTLNQDSTTQLDSLLIEVSKPVSTNDLRHIYTKRLKNLTEELERRLNVENAVKALLGYCVHNPDAEIVIVIIKCQVSLYTLFFTVGESPDSVYEISGW
jgi:hypothetical protein